MNLNLKAVYYCWTNFNNWGKGYTIKEAKKNAKLKAKQQFYVYAAVFDDPNEAELKNLFCCITANPIDGTPKYYDDGRTQEDADMIKSKHVGWLMVETNVPQK